MDRLNQEIRDAYRARAEVQRQADVEAQAASVEALEAEADRRRQDEAERREHATAEVQEAVGLLKADVIQWRGRFEATCAELETLIQELPELQRRIAKAGVTIRGVSVSPIDFTRRWERVGGMDAQLDALGTYDPASLIAQVVKVLRKRLIGVGIYVASAGVRYFSGLR